jgi:hypothetical protein
MLLVAGLSTAQPADATLTLACQGTVTTAYAIPADAKSQTISMGIIIDFASRTVAGFTFPGADDFPVGITAVNDVTIGFSGVNKTGDLTVSGSIDRVTGEIDAASVLLNPKTHNLVSSTSYSLNCKPAQRMF